MFVQNSRMSHILICVRVVIAASDVQSILDIPATDELHMECFARNYFKSLRSYVTSLGAYLYKREHALRNWRGDTTLFKDSRNRVRIAT